MKLYLLNITICLIICSSLFAQDSNVPEEGKQMPAFKLNKVTHFKSPKVSLKDFKGKWLVLDFWFTGCKACIQSFPQVNKIHKEFNNELTWIMVGLNDKKYGSDIQVVYERFRKSQKLEMPSAYDSVLINKWSINSMPHIILVNPKGIVHSITDGRDLTVEKISQLISGHSISFFPKNRNFIEFDPNNY